MITYIACLIHLCPTIPADKIIDLNVDPHTRTYLDHVEAPSREAALNYFFESCKDWSKDRRDAWIAQNYCTMHNPNG